MPRVTLDTNVYISALTIGGKPMDILQLAAAGHIELATSDSILDEMAQVLARPKFGWLPERIADARSLISSFRR